MAGPTWGDAGAGGTLPVTFTAVYDQAFVYDRAGLPGGERATPVHVDFGDGTGTDVTGDKRTRFVHDYTPGTYTVRLSVTDASGNPATWQLVVRVFPPLRPRIAERGTALAARVRGGDGRVLQYRWDFADGTTRYGRRVAQPPAGGVTLTVTDGTTTTATATRPAS